MIEDWLNQYAPNAPYLMIFGVLLLTGFGLPLPEDIPLIIGGYLCGETRGHPHLWIMIPLCMAAILIGDSLIYFAGKYWGRSLHRHWLMKRIVGGRNLAKARVLIRRHGAKFVFAARFLPGVRTPTFFTAGTFGMTYPRFLLCDLSAALVSVPWIMLLAYYFSEEIEYARDAASKGKTYGLIAAGLLLAALVGYHLLVARKLAAVKAGPDHNRGDNGDTPPAP